MSSEALWKKYTDRQDAGAREALVREHLPLVRRLAGRLSMALPPQVREEDLIGSGVIGLLEALQRFQPSAGVPFTVYAARRIRGAMLDELRRLSWAPRSFYARLRQVYAARQALCSSLGREPEVQELADYLDWTPAAVEQVYAQLNYYAVRSLEDLLFKQDPGAQQIAEASPGPEQQYMRKESSRMLAEALQELPPREQQILALYYQEELTLKEIAGLLKVSTARISQLHGRALLQLREKLIDRGF